MNYDLAKTHLERAHSILIESGELLDGHELEAFWVAESHRFALR